MELTKVIKSPILTEKTDILRMKNQVYVFKVDYAANKFQIKEAIETIFNVKVQDVNTIKVGKKPKSVGRFHGFQNRYKKAMVTLKEGQKINYLPAEEKAQMKEAELEQKEKEVKLAKTQKSKEIESKVAKKLASKKSVATKTTSTVKKTSTKRKVGGE
ncbi:50S ribosomal protein L23 [Mycoplasmopsis felis]|uniref:Large ribosomal subunit protein uL23 n=1 Tax=Mycoplasmopsis felis TaxID=33923 RepID=A0A809RS73_9BACT|nr:50S ribosomal protein L23 [Mycoplasmopsis felis]MCU9937790.1 50S ribosomal protein L23 [Mycoplasmopsis felis]UWV78309.1 50S ribosomal protein L23 [Mycoplasmopsis felis]WQQ02637.1 50S ribosomal protein L23 [Mycoplasmopsis felis]WQQ07586.1 50S ribosomal protein L23 [Mycoplasmopsis felis]WQQ08599.1 50S ribosomal protein L23 [Mycoplasmopsis felis]